jgi:hypothetical protein
MKIVQTFWTCDSKNLQELKNFRSGWFSKSHHYMGWAYSCLQLRKFYDEVELVTDELGKQLLIDELELPYTSVKVVLDDALADCPWHFWATSKIISYGYQDKPFIHVDGDIFISKPFEKQIESAQIISQNLESDFECYHIAMKEVKKIDKYVPAEILVDNEINHQIFASNMGIFGGNNIDFIHQFAKEALQFSKAYYDFSTVKNLEYFNCVFEQYLLYCMAKKNEIEIEYFFNPTYFFEDYAPISQFNKKGTNSLNYVHLVGYHKRTLSKCNTLSDVLKRDYPFYFHKVNQVIGEKSKFQHFLTTFKL